LSISQDTARRVFQIVDENRPLVECTFVFGETTVHCLSRFHFADIQTVIQKATDIMLATRDPLATIRVNGRLVLGILLPAAQIEPEFPEDVREVVPGMHYSIAEILEWDQSVFVVGNGIWEIGIQFQFGSQHVSFVPNFDSHLVPNALNMARDICGTLGFWDPNSQGTLIEPLQEPYYFEQLNIPPSFTAANFPMHFF
jgi:hypothetical protein